MRRRDGNGADQFGGAVEHFTNQPTVPYSGEKTFPANLEYLCSNLSDPAAFYGCDISTSILFADLRAVIFFIYLFIHSFY